MKVFDFFQLEMHSFHANWRDTFLPVCKLATAVRVEFKNKIRSQFNISQ